MILKSNFHTHTKRCCHAFGVEADYAKEAYDKGLSVLGFSDHAPFKDIVSVTVCSFRSFKNIFQLFRPKENAIQKKCVL